jgi:hypothetical protein
LRIWNIIPGICRIIVRSKGKAKGSGLQGVLPKSFCVTLNVIPGLITF